jgi:hypothetical protein
LRVFAGFCSFIVNILAMCFTIQTALFRAFCWQFAKIISPERANRHGKGEEMKGFET